MSNVTEVDLEQWCKDVINGGGGFVSYLQHEEGEVFDEQIDEEAVDERRAWMVRATEWALRCLTNPKYRGVLNEVIAESDRKLAATFAPTGHIRVPQEAVSDIVEKSIPTTEDEIASWVRRLCENSGIEVISWPDGTVGLVSVPNKYVQIIDAMQYAMVSLSVGEALPELVPPDTKKRSKQCASTENQSEQTKNYSKNKQTQTVGDFIRAVHKTCSTKTSVTDPPLPIVQEIAHKNCSCTNGCKSSTCDKL